MAKISISNVEVLDNPAKFTSKFKFKITFECLEILEDDLEWKLIYVSSAYNSGLDQILDSVLVGPIPVGRHQFILDTDPPDPKKIPVDDIVGVTVVLLEAFYKDQEFVRIGYFVSNEYEKEELKDEPPTEPIIEELNRHIIETDPRITRFAIKWGYDDEIVCEELTENGALEDPGLIREESITQTGDAGESTVCNADNKENEIRMDIQDGLDCKIDMGTPMEATVV